MSPTKILIVDDERDIVELLTYNLEKDGYEVFAAYDGEEALRTATEVQPSLILLDIMLPKIDGVEVCRRLREQEVFRDTCILFLTARSEEYSEVAGFDAGADDYITKPIKPRALLERLRTVCGSKQRGGPTTVVAPPASTVLEIDGLVIIPEEYRVTRNGTNVPMPRKEFELLLFLAKNSNRVFRREELLHKIWDNVHVTERTVDVHIRKLRSKIGKQYIHTVKGIGYKFSTK